MSQLFMNHNNGNKHAQIAQKFISSLSGNNTKLDFTLNPHHYYNDDSSIDIQVNNEKTVKNIGNTNKTYLLFSWFISRMYIIHVLCMLSLVPLVNNMTPGIAFNGCLYLILSPITIPSLCFFNLLHKNSRCITLGMGFISVVLGNITAICSCSICSASSTNKLGVDVGLYCLSMSLIIGNIQLLLLMNKKNIAVVMISTASSVVICGLSIAAPFLPSIVLSRRCYQSTIPCILWLFWQATRSSAGSSTTTTTASSLPCNETLNASEKTDDVLLKE